MFQPTPQAPRKSLLPDHLWLLFPFAPLAIFYYLHFVSCRLLFFFFIYFHRSNPSLFSPLQSLVSSTVPSLTVSHLVQHNPLLLPLRHPWPHHGKLPYELSLPASPPASAATSAAQPLRQLGHANKPPEFGERLGLFGSGGRSPFKRLPGAAQRVRRLGLFHRYGH